jgi:hypothetical protein
MMKTRKRRTDRNHVIYVIRNLKNGQEYIGLTAVNYGGNVQRTLIRRFQKHVQRAMSEDKSWGLCRAIRKFGPDRFGISQLEIVRGKKPAHARETELINTLKPRLNTFGAK